MRLHRYILTLAVLLLSATLYLPAATQAAERDILKTKLDNGLTVIIEEEHSAPVVAVQMWVRVGSADETDDEAGIAHVFEHMLFKGTKKRGLGQIAREVESAGGSINAFTTYDHTVYHLTLPSRRLSTGLDIISDAIQNSAFDPKELKKELEVVLEEIRMNEDSPGRKLYKVVLGEAYKVHPYGRPIIGFEKTVKSFTRDKILAFFRKWYVPNNMTLVVVGDLDKKKTLEEIKNLYRNFKRGPDPHKPRPAEPEQTETRAVIVPQPIVETRLAAAFHIPELKSPDTYTIDVLASILGEGETSRLYKRIKIKDRLVHSISAYAMTPKEPGIFLVTANLEAKKVNDTLTEVMEEIERLKSEGPAPEELERAKLGLESSFVYSRETMSGRADQLGYYETAAGDLSFEKKYVDGIRAVTAADIKAAIEKYLRPENMTVALLVPESASGALTREGVISKVNSAAQKAAAMFAKKAAGKEEITKTVLPNGITLIVKEVHSNPTVAFYATFPGGLRFETPETNGLGNLVAGMLTRGTKKRTREELAKEMEDMAGGISGFSGRNSTGASGKFLSRFFDRGLELLSDVIINPTFPEDELKKLKADVIAAIKRQEDYLPGYTFKLLYKELYRKHPYGMPVIGTVETVSSFTREDLIKHYNRIFTPKRMVLAIVGDVNTEYAIEKVKELFGDFNREPSPMPKLPVEKRPDGVRRTGEVKEKAQVNIGIGFLGTTIGSEDSYAMSVLTEVLAGQGGRLFVELRDKKSLAYSVSAFSRDGVEPGIFALYIASAPQKKEESINGLLKELERVLNEKIPDYEIERAKNSLIGGYEIGLQSVASQAADMATNELLGLGYDYYKKYPERIEAVTADDLMRVARKYITLDAYVISVVGPK